MHLFKNRWIIIPCLVPLFTFVIAGICIKYKDGAIIKNQIQGMSKRQDLNCNTAIDRIYLKAMYKGMSVFGNAMYPEAAKILDEYIYGKKDSLELSNSYFRKAPFIQSILLKNKSEIIGPIYLNLKDDRRIAYAINGFYIKRYKVNDETHFRLFQDILFEEKSNTVITSFTILGTRFAVPDKLVHVIRKRTSKKLYVFTEW
jgi:hypothetical protein